MLFWLNNKLRVLQKLGQTLACHYQHIIPIYHTNSSFTQQNSMKPSKQQPLLWQEAVRFLCCFCSILRHLRRLNANVAHVKYSLPAKRF
jgi:hypothetical protein